MKHIRTYGAWKFFRGECTAEEWFDYDIKHYKPKFEFNYDNNWSHSTDFLLKHRMNVVIKPITTRFVDYMP